MILIKRRLYTIIFESETKANKVFDEVLLVLIIIGIGLIMLKSISTINLRYHHPLKILEWSVTVIFSLEYIARVWVADKPVKYILSFYGLVDLFALLPTYIGIFFTGGQSLIVIRALRLLRVFRIFKLSRYTQAGRVLIGTLRSNREKTGVFFMFYR